MWAKISKNAMQALKKDMYAPVSTREAQETLQRRTLGTSKLRLVPKKSGAVCTYLGSTGITAAQLHDNIIISRGRHEKTDHFPDNSTCQ